MNIFTVIVGDSAKARKGTSLGHVKRIFETVEPEYMKARQVSGLSSGEGIIAAVRDEIPNPDPEKANSPLYTGVDDKRLLVLETEFGGVLQVLSRDGNKLSAVIRDAYDHGDLRTLTKEPMRATNAHVSIIGHITKAELTKYLRHTELFNGFANRFIWIPSKRSKLMSLGGSTEELASRLRPLFPKLVEAISFGRKGGRISFSREARIAWDSLYSDLAKPLPGLLDTLSARAESQIVRLSSLCALLDRTNEISVNHLRTATAIWDYSLEGLRFIFGDSTGNQQADKILAELRSCHYGLTQTEIIKLFNNNVNKRDLAIALECLQDNDLVEKVEEANGSRRRQIRWNLKKNDGTN